MKPWMNSLAVGLAILVGAAAGCGPSKTGPNAGNLTGNVAIDGSSTVFPIAEAIAEEFRNVQPNVKLTVGFSGTGGGFKKLIAKEIDICNASRPVSKDEIEKLQAGGIELLEFAVAMDGLAVIVHKDNDWVDCITRSELHAIWKDGSTVKTWKDVRADWPDLPIKLYGAGTDSGTFDYFTEAINGKSKSCRKEYSPSEDDNVLVQGVANDKGALGYFGYAYYESNKNKIKLLSINGEKDKKSEGEKAEEKKPAGAADPNCVSPSDATVLDGTYPLARPLFIYVSKESLKRPEVAAVVKFYLENAKTLSKEVRYTPATDDIYAKNMEVFAKAVGSHSKTEK